MNERKQVEAVEIPGPLQARLIFNPASGDPRLSHDQLAEILDLLQDCGIQAEVHLVRPDSDLDWVGRDAVRRGIRTIIVSGGDGTIDSVAGALAGTPARLGIVPTGTQNNTARALGIPLNDVAGAIQIIRRGRRLRVDIGQARSRRACRMFLEMTSIGLLSALYPAADDVQHGRYERIGDLLATLVRAEPAHFRMKLQQEGACHTIEAQAHMVLVSNMPFIGRQFQPARDISYQDSSLDVFLYASLTKLDLLGYAVEVALGAVEDPRIKHFRVRSAVIQTDPPLPVMADGFMIGEGSVKLSLLRQALTVMAGETPHPGLAARSETLSNSR